MIVYECYSWEMALKAGLRALLNNMLNKQWCGRRRGKLILAICNLIKRNDDISCWTLDGCYTSKELFLRSSCIAVCVRDECRLVCHVAFHMWTCRDIGWVPSCSPDKEEKTRGSIHVLLPFGCLPCQPDRTVLSDEWMGQDKTRSHWQVPRCHTPLIHCIGYTDVSRSEFRFLQSPSVLRSTLLSSSFIYYHSTKYGFVVEREVITAVSMKNTVSWVVTPCSSETVRRFGGSYSLPEDQAMCSYETSGSVRTVQRYNKDDCTLYVFVELAVNAWLLFHRRN
jgi:hypothetical protein